MEIGIITQKFITFDSEQTYLFLFSCLLFYFNLDESPQDKSSFI